MENSQETTIIQKKIRREQKYKEYLQKTIIRVPLALFCCLLWGSAFPTIKLGYALLGIERGDISGQALFAGYRFFLAGAVIFVLYYMKEKSFPKLNKESATPVLAIGVVQIGVQYLLFYIGLANMTGTRSALINACHGFITIIVAHYLIKAEPMSWQKTFGCIIGFAGIAALNIGDTGAAITLAGDGMIFAATVIYGIGSVYVKMVSQKVPPMVMTSYQLLSGGFLLILAGLLTGGSLESFTWKGIMLFGYLVLLSAVAFSVWNTLIKYNPVGKIAIFGSSIPAFATILSGLMLGEDIFKWQNLVALIGVRIGRAHV